MKHVSTLAPQDWMKSDETRAVMAALGEGEAFFVGGCVRNALLGEGVDDIDIATKHTPEEVIKRLEAANIKSIPTGIDHGTITAVIDKKSFEITTLRKDVDTDGRHATVAFSTDWLDDARRRDFTMNTLLMDVSGKIFDPLGQGLDDLRARKVVFVGDPAKRIAEDYLRILRYFRFHALYGSGDMDDAALAACKSAADKIHGLSRERITQEFFKILSVDNATNILNIMFENNILNDFSNSGYNEDMLRYVCDFQCKYNLRFLSSRLYVLAGLNPDNLEKFESDLLIPKVFKRDITAIHGALSLPDLSDDHAVKVAVYKHGRVPTAQALMIELAQDRVNNASAAKALDIVQKWDIPDFPLSGEDLIKEGYQAGPELGAELTRREEVWIKNGFN